MLSIFPPRAGGLGSMDVRIVEADVQQRTPRYQTDIWRRPGRVPSKASGRKGTRRAWKRQHPPAFLWAWEEPKDVLVLANRLIVATSAQYAALRREIQKGKPHG
ncbi:MAG TPA: hypothetical protein PKY87_02250 [Terricaulis sp.]|nr:hypothetical protein [Terricaulis sp.]